VQRKTEKVVDSNYLRSPKLLAYLQETTTNYVVLTDYAAMEAFKRNPLNTLRHSMEILSDYPRQVIVLKSTTAICGLHGRQAGLRRRMVNEGQTREFAAWCKALKKLEHTGHSKFERHILALGRDADAHIARVQTDAASMPAFLPTWQNTTARKKSHEFAATNSPRNCSSQVSGASKAPHQKRCEMI